MRLSLTMSEPTGFVKYHRQALRKSSTLRQVSRADRATLLDYIALARWQAPFAGCLCEDDGTAWSRARRAEEVGENYTTIKRTEERLVAAGLITFQVKDAGHAASVGRVHVTNFAHFQTTGDPSEMKGHSSEYPSKVKGQPFKNEGSTLQKRRDNPSKVKGTASEEEPFQSEGSPPERACNDWPADETTSEEEPFKSEGEAAQEVKKLKKKEEEGEPDPASPSLKEQVCKVLAPLMGGVGAGLVQTVEHALYLPEAKDVILVVAMELAARHADGQNVNISWLAGNVQDRIQRNEDRAGPDGGLSRDQETRRDALRKIDDDNARDRSAQEEAL